MLGRLLRRNAALLYTSFLASGLVTVCAQRFFAAHTLHVQAWLAITLLLGTVGSSAAVRAAERFGLRGPARPFGVGLCCGLGLCAWALFHVRAPLAYAALHVWVRMHANFLAQTCDSRAARLAQDTERTRNDQVGTAARFLGMFLGPLWFGAVAPGSAASSVVLLLLTGVAASSAISVAAAPGPRRAAGPGIAGPPSLAWIAALLIYGSYYLLASNALHLVRDSFHFANATVLGGAVIATVYGSAILSTVVIGLVSGRDLRLRWLLPAPALMAATGLLLLWGLRPGWVLLEGASALLGVAFATFLLAFRNHATRRAAAGEPGWLGAFNNLGNHSALVGFTTMLGLVGLGKLVTSPYDLRLFWGVLTIGVLGLGAAALAHHHAPAERPASAVPPLA